MDSTVVQWLFPSVSIVRAANFFRSIELAGARRVNCARRQLFSIDRARGRSPKAHSRGDKLTESDKVCGPVTADANKFNESIPVIDFLITRLIVQQLCRSDLLVVALILKDIDRVFPFMRVMAGGVLCCGFQSRLATQIVVCNCEYIRRRGNGRLQFAKVDLVQIRNEVRDLNRLCVETIISQADTADASCSGSCGDAEI